MNKKYPLAISFGRAMKFRELGIFQHTEYCYNLDDKKEKLHYKHEVEHLHTSLVIKAASLLDMAPVAVELNLPLDMEDDILNCNMVFDAIELAIEQKVIDVNEIKLILAKEAEDNQQSQTNH